MPLPEKADLIRQACTEEFEGIPCNYPNCTCSPAHRAGMEKWADEIHPKILNGTYDGAW